MACPFFMPSERLQQPFWPHPARLPLGDGWRGYCTVPGQEGAQPSDEQLKDSCNLGYAQCSRLPLQRSCDAVRLAVVGEHNAKFTICYVCEVAHTPAAHGRLEFDASAARWTISHPDPRLQKMAECYLDSYLRRRQAS